MKVSIHSIQKTLFSGEAEKLICHTPQGQITVLDDHLPIISTLTGPNVEIVKIDGEKSLVALELGILEVRPESEVVILVNTKI